MISRNATTCTNGQDRIVVETNNIWVKNVLLDFKKFFIGSYYLIKLGVRYITISLCAYPATLVLLWQINKVCLYTVNLVLKSLFVVHDYWCTILFNLLLLQLLFNQFTWTGIRIVTFHIATKTSNIEIRWQLCRGISL